MSQNSTNKFLFIDVETNGLPLTYNKPYTDIENWPRIVQIAWIICDEGLNIIDQKRYNILNEEDVLQDFSNLKNNKINTLTFPRIEWLVKFDITSYNIRYVISYDFDLLNSSDKMNLEEVCNYSKIINLKDFQRTDGYMNFYFDMENILLRLHKAIDFCFKLFSENIFSDISVKINTNNNFNAGRSIYKNELIPYRKIDKWGYVDRNHNIEIKCIYDSATFFCNGIGLVCKDKKQIAINRYGKQIKEFSYKNYTGTSILIKNEHNFFELLEINPYDNYSVSKCRLSKLNFKLYLKEEKINVKPYKRIIIYNVFTKKYTDYIYDDVSSFEDGISIVSRESKYGAISEDGNEIIDCKYEYIGAFHDGISCVKLNNKYGYIDNAGKIVVDFIYDFGGVFSNGIACVKLNNKYGAIDKYNVTIIPFDYESEFKFVNDVAIVSLKVENGKIKKGLINIHNQKLSEFKYFAIRDFMDGLAGVMMEIVKFTYNENGNAKDYYEYTRGFININGEEVIPCVYTEISDFENNIAVVKYNNSYGLITKEGIVLAKPRYSNNFIINIDKGFIKLRLQNGRKEGVINFKGEFIVPCIFDQIFFYGYNKYITCNFDSSKNSYLSGIILHNLERQEIRRLNYKHITELTHGFYAVVDNLGNAGAIDIDGAIILEPNFVEIKCINKYFFLARKKLYSTTYVYDFKAALVYSFEYCDERDIQFVGCNHFIITEERGRRYLRRIDGKVILKIEDSDQGRFSCDRIKYNIWHIRINWRFSRFYYSSTDFIIDNDGNILFSGDIFKISKEFNFIEVKYTDGIYKDKMAILDLDCNFIFKPKYNKISFNYERKLVVKYNEYYCGSGYVSNFEFVDLNGIEFFEE